ncbi:MAG: zinc-binding alcohol dehydrogenase family protein [Oleiphilaceae bacterium]|nr:zinc-binding alcohol dehydrogenase family protein [Oleiphilaceae bacterium]
MSINNKMKAVGLTKYLPVSDDNALKDFELAIPKPWAHDLLVQVDAVSVNPVDTKVRSPKDTVEKEPKVLGYDAVGIVKAVGDATRFYKPGDRVYYAGDITRQGSNSEYQLVDERIVGPAPSKLSNSEAAAMPLISLTAWEALFERLGISLAKDNSEKTLLIIGGSGSVGAIATQMAARLAGLKVVVTASKRGAIEWCVSQGAAHVVNHHDDIQQQISTLGYKGADYILCCSHTDQHFDAMCDIIKPQGKICCIVDNVKPLPLNKLKPKSASLVWEFMFTRAMFKTPDMIEQRHILSEVSRLLDEGILKSVLADTYRPINAKNLLAAHQVIENGELMGKLVVEGW